MTETTEPAPASGASASGGRKGGLNAMLLPELKQLAGGLGIKSTGLRKGDLIEAIKAAQSGGQSGAQTGGQGGGQTRARAERPEKAAETSPEKPAEKVTEQRDQN